MGIAIEDTRYSATLPTLQWNGCRANPSSVDHHLSSIAIHRTLSSYRNESIEETYVLRCEEPREVGLAAILKEGQELKGGGKRQTM